MTKEELEKEAEEKCAKYKLVEMETYEVEAYIEGAEPREKRIAELEKENAELKKQQFSLRNERNTFLAQNEQYEKDLIDFNENLTKAKEIILRLYNAGRDVLMCRSEEKAYDNLSEAINDSNIEQFLKEKELVLYYSG